MNKVEAAQIDKLSQMLDDVSQAHDLCHGRITELEGTNDFLRIQLQRALEKRQEIASLERNNAQPTSISPMYEALDNILIAALATFSDETAAPAALTSAVENSAKVDQVANEGDADANLIKQSSSR